MTPSRRPRPESIVVWRLSRLYAPGALRTLLERSRDPRTAGRLVVVIAPRDSVRDGREICWRRSGLDVDGTRRVITFLEPEFLGVRVTLLGRVVRPMRGLGVRVMVEREGERR